MLSDFQTTNRFLKEDLYLEAKTVFESDYPERKTRSLEV